MKIKRIVVEFEDVDSGHTTEAVFVLGRWTFNGEVYGRIMIALHDVWKRLRQEVVQ